MARYALVNSQNIVENVIQWDPESPDGKTWKPPEGLTPVLDNPPSASPGFIYDGAKFAPPPEKAGTPEGQAPPEVI